MRVRILAVAAGLAAPLFASAANIGELVRPVCGEPSTKVIVTVPADKGEAVGKVIERLEAANLGNCVQRGPIGGAWILEGDSKAMLTGIVPAGADSAPHLQVWGPPFRLVGPLKVEVIKTDTVISNNTN